MELKVLFYSKNSWTFVYTSLTFYTQHKLLLHFVKKDLKRAFLPRYIIFLHLNDCWCISFLYCCKNVAAEICRKNVAAEIFSESSSTTEIIFWNLEGNFRIALKKDETKYPVPMLKSIFWYMIIKPTNLRQISVNLSPASRLRKWLVLLFDKRWKSSSKWLGEEVSNLVVCS